MCENVKVHKNLKKLNRVEWGRKDDYYQRWPAVENLCTRWEKGLTLDQPGDSMILKVKRI